MIFVRGAEQITVRAIIRRVPDNFIELRKEVDRIFRHLNVDWSRELRTHAAHALAGRPVALMRLALKHQHVGTALLREMISDARSDNAAADDDYVRGFSHGSESFAQRRSDRKSKKARVISSRLCLSDKLQFVEDRCDKLKLVGH